MGLFDMFKKKDAAPSFPVVLAADAAGAFVKMEDIPDEVFAQGILGQGCGIDPSEGKVYAPCDGEITQAPDTLHAFGITTPGGVEVLIHVGGIIGCVHTIVDNLMAHRLHNLAQGGFDQGVLGGLAVFIDQCNFHGLISPVYCILEGSRVVCSGNPIYHITSSRKYLVFTV